MVASELLAGFWRAKLLNIAAGHLHKLSRCVVPYHVLFVGARPQSVVSRVGQVREEEGGRGVAVLRGIVGGRHAAWGWREETPRFGPLGLCHVGC